ncbi:MAG: sulfite exporter TauE/SafE family protein [Planctomycetota bacterium]
MTSAEIGWLALILFLAPALQAAVGFGAGLFAIPALVWGGMTLPQATGAALMSVLVQSSLNCYHAREQLPWRETMPIFFWRALSLPAGVMIMAYIASFDLTIGRQVIGWCLLVSLGMQLLIRPTPRESVHPGWTAVAGICSGLLAGGVGIGGPPACLWVLAHDWPPLKQRSCLWLMFLLLLPLHTGLLIFKFGSPLVAALLAALAVSPVALLGSYVGATIGHRLNRRQLTIAMLTLIFLIAVRSIVAPN